MDIDIDDLTEGLTMTQKVEYASFGLGGIILLVGILLYISGSIVLGGALFVAGMVIAFLPYALWIYFRDKKYRQMEQEFPIFLRNLSEAIKGGMTLPQAFQHAAQTEYGRLDEEVQRAAHQLSWGVPFPEVMERMSRHIHGSGLIRRSFAIIMQSYESGGNIAETLDAIAANASRIQEAEKERQAVLQQQVYVIYAIHFLFLGIIIALYLLLNSFLLDIGQGVQGSSGIGLGFGEVKNFCQTGIARPICTLCPTFGMGSPGEKICYYKSLFLLMLIIEGVFNGLVVGEITEGKISAGVKHSLIMGTVGFIVYLVAITVL